MSDNIGSVVARAVAMQHERDGVVDDREFELVVDNSDIIIAELEAELVTVAANIGTTRGRILPWSEDVGVALALMDSTLARIERLEAILGIAKAHLEVGQNVPEGQNSGYIAAALEVLKSMKCRNGVQQ